MDHKEDLIARYNYDEFTPAKVFPFLNFKNSPMLGQKIKDFTLLDLDENEITLSAILAQNSYTIVEFGSFT